MFPWNSLTQGLYYGIELSDTANGDGWKAIRMETSPTGGLQNLEVAISGSVRNVTIQRVYGTY